MKFNHTIILILLFYPVALLGENSNQNDSQNKEIIKLFNNYYTIKDKGEYEQAYSYLASSTKQLIQLKRWIEIASNSKIEMGKLISRDIKKITWYNNPKGSQSPGIYAAVDFVGKTEKANIYCGYVIWKKTINGGFALLREEENHINKSTEASLRKQGRLEEFKTKIGC